MFKRNEQCPAASTLQVTSKYAYIKPTQNQQRSFSQDLLCKPHSRSLLNKYLHDNHDYLAASVLRYVEDETLIYVCVNNTCKLPVEDSETAILTLNNF